MRIEHWFGPVMLAWFPSLAALGLLAIPRDPAILRALRPATALAASAAQPATTLAVLGTVLLAVTGAEALYADLGRFGRRVIARAWILLVCPALVLNDLGQAARTAEPGAGSTFYAIVPGQVHLPVVVLSTLAAIIASQAVVTGLVALTWQAVADGSSPKIDNRAMSPHDPNDRYFPAATLAMAVVSCGLVVIFRASDRLADAYGVAVAGTMVCTSVLYAAFLLRAHPRLWRARLTLLLPLVLLDIAFLAAGLTKIRSGGWTPLLAAAAITAWGLWHLRIGERARHEGPPRRRCAGPGPCSAARSRRSCCKAAARSVAPCLCPCRDRTPP